MPPPSSSVRVTAGTNRPRYATASANGAVLPGPSPVRQAACSPRSSVHGRGWSSSTAATDRSSPSTTTSPASRRIGARHDRLAVLDDDDRLEHLHEAWCHQLSARGALRGHARPCRSGSDLRSAGRFGGPGRPPLYGPPAFGPGRSGPGRSSAMGFGLRVSADCSRATLVLVVGGSRG